MLKWQYYPKSDKITAELEKVVECFKGVEERIDSHRTNLQSNGVLGELREPLTRCGFIVEHPGRDGKIKVPVLFGRNGKLEKAFNADAFKKDAGIVVEIEAGRGVMNNQFLKDLFEACVMHDVNYLVIAVRNKYLERDDFEEVANFLDTLYASSRLTLPLKGILLIGY